jgi:peptide deformylase
MAMTLKIVQVGEPVLRNKAWSLSNDEILSAPVQQLIDMMRETMRDAPGVGLAAPQIGEPLQLAVIEDRTEYSSGIPKELLDERGRSTVPFQVIINPQIYFEQNGPVEFFEGCLSLNGFTAIVPRALSVRVECLNERAEPIVIRASGWYARILQHEIDHLNGTLYIDRMEPRSFMAVSNYARFWKDKSIEEVKEALAPFRQYDSL